MSKKIHSKYMYKEPSVLSMLAFVYISNNTTYFFFWNLSDCGNWSGTPQNSALRYTSGTSYGSFAISTCKTGFHVINQSNVYLESAQCLANGSWSKPRYLGCEAVGMKLKLKWPWFKIKLKQTSINCSFDVANLF